MKLGWLQLAAVGAAGVAVAEVNDPFVVVAILCLGFPDCFARPNFPFAD